jgi:hypothetical protein
VSRRPPPLTIGYVEQIDLPEWGIFALPVKVDTGALTSALHVENLSQWEDGWLTFDVPYSSSSGQCRRHVEACVVRLCSVRGSNGEVRRRPFVATQLNLGPLEREIEIGLVDRTEMNYRMLLGRSALSGACVVDPARCYLL